VDNFEGVSYPDAQQLFSLGDGAIYPAGTWDIAFFQSQGVPIGFFGPPVLNGGDTCYISDHTDIALGLNAASPNAEAGKIFLDWVASDEFVSLYSNALPGFYSLSSNPVTLDNEVAQQAVDLRQTCESTIRNSYQILSRGEPNLETELGLKSAAVINGTLTPEEAAAELQAGLKSWYTPGA
jgi:raffinose/stachyose/melibiose transport system substrate-binding protein